MTESVTYSMGVILGKVSSCYLQAIIISFFVAGLIWGLNKILTSDRISNK